MAGAVEMELRWRVIEALAGGLSPRAAAGCVASGEAPAGAGPRPGRQPGRDEALAEGGRKRALLAAPARCLRGGIIDQAARPRAELAQPLAAKRSRRGEPSPSGAWRKRRALPCNKTPAPVAAPARRAIWSNRRAGVAGPRELAPARRGCSAAPGASTQRARLEGRSQRGARGRAPLPPGHGQPTPCVGARRRAGLTAPRVLAGARPGAAGSASGAPGRVPTPPPRRSRPSGPPARSQAGGGACSQPASRRRPALPAAKPSRRHSPRQGVRATPGDWAKTRRPNTRCTLGQHRRRSPRLLISRGCQRLQGRRIGPRLTAKGSRCTAAARPPDPNTRPNATGLSDRVSQVPRHPGAGACPGAPAPPSAIRRRPRPPADSPGSVRRVRRRLRHHGEVSLANGTIAPSSPTGRRRGS